MATFLFCAMFSPFVLLGFIFFAHYLLYKRSKFRPKGHFYDELYKIASDRKVDNLCRSLPEGRIEELRKNIDECSSKFFLTVEIDAYLTYFLQWLNVLNKDYKIVNEGLAYVKQDYNKGNIPLKDYRSYCKKFDSYLSDSKKLIEACERCASQLTSLKNTSGIIIEGEFIEVKHGND